MRYKRFLKGTMVQATKKYDKWPWIRHLEFLDYTLTPRLPTSNVSDSQISETPLKEAGTPPPSEDAESRCPLSSIVRNTATTNKKTEEKAVNGGHR